METIVSEKPEIEIGDIVICDNTKDFKHLDEPKKIVGLVVDRTYTLCIIKAIETGRERHWPLASVTLWKKCPE